MNECVTLLTDDAGTGCRRGWSGTQGKDGTADGKKEEYGTQYLEMQRQDIGNTIGSTEGDRGALLCRKMEGKYIAYKSLGFLPIADGLKEIGTDIANLEHHRCYDNIPEFFAT